MVKKWYQSKTIWFTVLFALVQIAGIFGYADFTPNSQALEVINLVVAGIFLVLRLVTDKKIVSGPLG